MAGTFSNPRLAALPCELALGCSFAENFVTKTTMAENMGTETGTGVTANYGIVGTGAGRFIFDITPQESSFSAVVKFKTSTTHDGEGILLGNNEPISSPADGFAVWVDADGVKANHSNGAALPTQCAVDLDYADGEIHTVTYIVDMAGGEHHLYVDALEVDTQVTTIDETIGEALGVFALGAAGVYFTGTLTLARIFGAMLTEFDHAAYAEGLTEFLRMPFAVYRCDDFCDDTVGNKILDRTYRVHEIDKADRVTAAKFPTFSETQHPHYVFDGSDDYLSNPLNLDALFKNEDGVTYKDFTITALITTPVEIYPIIQQHNNFAGLYNDLTTEGDFEGNLFSLIIYEVKLSALQLLHDEYQQLYWLDRGFSFDLYSRLAAEDTEQLMMFMGSDPVLYKDYSRNLLSGTPTLVTNNGADGCTFESSNSNINVADTANLRTSELTIVIQGGFDSSEVEGVIAEKGANLKLDTNGNSIGFLGSTIAHTFDNNRHIVVVAKYGFEPRFYVDGVYIGEGSSAVSPDDTATEDLIIGNGAALNKPTQYAIEQICHCNSTLTDKEIRAIWDQRRVIEA